MTHDEELYRIIDEVLYYVWDPIGVAETPQARNEYHEYVPQVFRLLKEDVTATVIAEHLLKTSIKHMAIDQNRHGMVVAEILLQWKAIISRKYNH
jgi:hypothetical protein